MCILLVHKAESPITLGATCLTEISSPEHSSKSSVSMDKSKRLTDEEILERWYPEHNFKGGRKFCTAAREFLELAGKWPWEWCVRDLNPRRWRPALVHDLKRLAETYKKSGKNLDEAKWPLIRAMMRRKTTD